MSAADPVFFASSAEFRSWLESNHASAAELVVGFYNKGSGRGGVTYAEAVDGALCFGWIDGVRRSLGAESFTNRFTPRRSRSIWSAVNIARVAELRGLGLMAPAGLAAFEGRDLTRAGLYSFEQAAVAFDPTQQESFRQDGLAWAYFEAQPAGYRKAATWWVVSAKQEATRARRLAKLMEDSLAGRRLAHLVSPGRQP